MRHCNGKYTLDIIDEYLEKWDRGKNLSKRIKELREGETQEVYKTKIWVEERDETGMRMIEKRIDYKLLERKLKPFGITVKYSKGSL